MNSTSLRPCFLRLLLATGLLSMLVVATSAQCPTARDLKESSIARLQLESFSVIGLAARTTNAREKGSDGVIPKQWQRFLQQGVQHQIPHRGKDLYAVYTSYASDHNGEYTYVVGVKVGSESRAPAGMVRVDVSAGCYAVLTTDKGSLREVVPLAWNKIFQLEATGKLHRAYRTDFEVYDQYSQSPADAQVDIFLGLQ